MVFEIVMAILIGGLFVAAFVWGEDSRIGFSDPRCREGWMLSRRGELR